MTSRRSLFAWLRRITSSSGVRLIPSSLAESVRIVPQQNAALEAHCQLESRDVLFAYSLLEAGGDQAEPVRSHLELYEPECTKMVSIVSSR